MPAVKPSERPPAYRVCSQLEKLRVKPRHDVRKRRFQPGGLVSFLLFLAQALCEKSLFLVEAEAVFGFLTHSDQNLPARLRLRSTWRAELKASFPGASRLLKIGSAMPPTRPVCRRIGSMGVGSGIFCGAWQRFQNWSCFTNAVDTYDSFTGALSRGCSV